MGDRQQLCPWRILPNPFIVTARNDVSCLHASLHCQTIASQTSAAPKQWHASLLAYTSCVTAISTVMCTNSLRGNYAI